ncbi:hypothetical protein BJF93_01975 [Xaviernesmea oryzae]|uniref:SHOCT domain-containing protein n=1 Tax=Xaviernesmea oryzae TaxID=464029 RepID=A0A1Q9B3F2_9HYPH|nr:DUF805 domain-containing protein [Xaviernesmea oryzae]OLP62580.1 hypothetical protein BJF93_01975 [Xaviernesmea oryzae]SEM18740.1 Uncharacterized membrane protein YhaH, DUF805 family [Xaviernesmea oryzae]
MGSFSSRDWQVFLVYVLVPLVFVLRRPPPGSNRFGPPARSMGVGEAIASYFRNYVNSRGRATRSEFWYATLFTFLVSLALWCFETRRLAHTIWGLVTFLPTLSLTIRRMHDINRSGRLLLLSLFVPVGTIALLVWHCLPARDKAADETASSLDLDGGPRPASREMLDGLERLIKQKEDGHLSTEEFEVAKRKLLGA